MILPDARMVEMTGFSLIITTVVLVLLPLACIGVCIRMFVRFRDGGFGLDDGLLLCGLMIYVADTGLAVHAVSVGVGSKNENMNEWMQSEAQKFYIIWITVYVSAVAVIKSSVCLTLMRICQETRTMIKRTIWALLALTWASFCVTFFGILTFCRPIEANWNTTLVLEGKGTCASPQTLIGISHTNTATSIVTDIGCVVLPGILLWETQMSTKAKLQVSVLLSLASIASVSTIARAPFISRYNNPTDNLMYYIGFIVLLSCVELAVGCIAASLPSIRRLYKEIFGRKNGSSYNTSQRSDGLVTIGGSSGLAGRGDRSKPNRGKGFVNPSDRGTTTTHIDGGEGSWERLHDTESSKSENGSMKTRATTGHIQAVYTYSVEMGPMRK